MQTGAMHKLMFFVVHAKNIKQTFTSKQTFCRFYKILYFQTIYNRTSLLFLLQSKLQPPTGKAQLRLFIYIQTSADPQPSKEEQCESIFGLVQVNQLRLVFVHPLGFTGILFMGQYISTLE